MEIIDINGQKIQIEIAGKTVTVKAFMERASIVVIPESISLNGENYVVDTIGKKAFLGNKGLREVVLPTSIKRIDDWAFSQCNHLRRITIPALFNGDANGACTLGRRVFEGCDGMEQICAGKDDNSTRSYLCAALVSRLPAEYLLWDDDIGSKNWYDKWDLALTGFIVRKDNEGYTDTVLCGEEDISYDGVGMVDGEMPGETYEYVKKVSKNKSYLCLMRLVHDEMLEDTAREIYCDYVRKHKRKVANEAAWYALNEDVGDELDYYKVYAQIAETTSEELTEMIGQMSEDKAQAKAYLISLRPRENVFDSFEL